MKLERGDNNINVKLLQEKLGIEPIGNFGPKTEKAVKEFQIQHGLEPDGVVKDKLWELIMKKSMASPVPLPLANVGGLKLDKLKYQIESCLCQRYKSNILKLKTAPLVWLAKAKAGSSPTLTWTAWLQYLPSSTHNT